MPGTVEDIPDGARYGIGRCLHNRIMKIAGGYPGQGNGKKKLRMFRLMCKRVLMVLRKVWRKHQTNMSGEEDSTVVETRSNNVELCTAPQSQATACQRPPSIISISTDYSDAEPPSRAYLQVPGGYRLSTLYGSV